MSQCSCKKKNLLISFMGKYCVYCCSNVVLSIIHIKIANEDKSHTIYMYIHCGTRKPISLRPTAWLSIDLWIGGSVGPHVVGEGESPSEHVWRGPYDGRSQGIMAAVKWGTPVNRQTNRWDDWKHYLHTNCVCEGYQKS